MIREFKLDQCTDFVELGFRMGDLVQVREETFGEDIIFYKGVYVPGSTSTQTKKITKKEPPMLYVGCMFDKTSSRKPGMILHCIHGDSVWHAFFWNCMEINQNIVKVKL